MRMINRLFCLHHYTPVSPLELGSICRGLYRCKCCGKLKFTEQIKSWEIVDDGERRSECD